MLYWSLESLDFTWIGFFSKTFLITRLVGSDNTFMDNYLVYVAKYFIIKKLKITGRLILDHWLLTTFMILCYSISFAQGQQLYRMMMKKLRWRHVAIILWLKTMWRGVMECTRLARMYIFFTVISTVPKASQHLMAPLIWDALWKGTQVLDFTHITF